MGQALPRVHLLDPREPLGFQSRLETFKILVDHNLSFDISNITRYFYNYKVGYKLPDLFDTMVLTKDLMNLKTAKGRKKNPSLNELYKFLFGKSMDTDSAHTADYDVESTMKCYEKLVKGGLLT